MNRISSRAFSAQLLGGIVPAAPDSFVQSEGLVDWCIRNRVTVEGRLLDFVGRPWLIDVYNDRAQHVVLSKATQVGGSVWAIIRCLHLANTVPGWRGWVYFFPTKGDVIDFSQTRVSPLVDENAVLRRASATSIRWACGRWARALCTFAACGARSDSSAMMKQLRY